MHKTILLYLFVILSQSNVTAQDSLAYSNYATPIVQAQEYSKLISYFSEEYKKYPKNENVLRWLGYSYYLKGETKQTEKYYKEAILVNPKCTMCYMNIGLAHASKDHFAKAKLYLDKAISIDPKNGKVYSTRAEINDYLGDKFGALQDYKKSVELEPNNPKIYLRRAEFNEKYGYPLLALDDYTKAIDLSDEKSTFYQSRSEYYFKQGKSKEALTDINEAIKLDIENPNMYTSRAAIYHEMNENAKAIVDYTKAISLDPDNSFAYLFRGKTYYAMEDMDAACKDYWQIKKLVDAGKETNPDYKSQIKMALEDLCDASKPSYYYQRGIAQYNLGNYEKAVDNYIFGLLKHPNNVLLLSFKGNAQMALGQYEAAAKEYELTLKNKDKIMNNNALGNLQQNSEPNTQQRFLHSTYLSLAECYFNINNTSAALENINHAIDIAQYLASDKINATTYNLRGMIYIQKGAYKKALIDLEKSINFYASEPSAYVNRAIAKVSLAENIKTRTIFINAEFKNQPLGLSWVHPMKTKSNAGKLQSALSDCDTALGLDKNAYAYYIRGQINLMLGQDYCGDLLNAQLLGIEVEQELIGDCE